MSLAASVIVNAGRPKNGAHSPSPPVGTWSGRTPIHSPRRSAASNAVAPRVFAGTSDTLPRRRPGLEQRPQRRLPRRAEHHGDRSMAAGELCGDLEAAEVRGEEHDALAAVASPPMTCSMPSTDCTRASTSSTGRSQTQGSSNIVLPASRIAARASRASSP